MKVTVYNQSGEKTPQEVELSDRIFSLANIKPEVVHQVVVSLMSSRRSSIAHSKTRGEVRGGGKKPWQQKGTGRARVGSIRSPLWRGGGITFGPRNQRNWELGVNKKTKILALFSVLTDKARSGQLAVLEDMQLSSQKTKELSVMLAQLRAKIPALGRKVTIVITDKQKNLVRASRNLPGVAITKPSSLDILELLSRSGVLVMRDALPGIEKTYLKTK